MTALPRLSAVVLGTDDPHMLAGFYRDLFGWDVVDDEPGWVMLRPAGGGTGLSFQEEPDHVAPVWPQEPGSQQMQLHLDIEVDDLGAETQRALELGASLAPHQPQHDVRVLLDPSGHPFCLWARGPAL
jgi:catechol 2,3-dioxygenase-like lactoylglutathione lyase family enzyme